MKSNPEYSMLFGSVPILEEDTTRRTLFREESVSTASESTESTDYRGGAIIKCLDEMKRLNDECQKR